jgi:hypothetical protein
VRIEQPTQNSRMGVFVPLAPQYREEICAWQGEQAPQCRDLFGTKLYRNAISQLLADSLKYLSKALNPR